VNVTRYRKSATKDVRPFFGTARLEQALDRATIRLFEDTPFVENTSFIVEEQDASRLAIAVRPSLSEEALAGGGIPRASLALAVTAVNPFLKRTVLVDKLLLSARTANEVHVGSEVLERLGGGANLTIEVALCLASEATREPGKPYLAGHWVSKKSFDLSAPKLTEDFDIDPMEDEDWIKLGFPPKTLYHVEYFSGVNEPVSKDRALAKVRIHADVYKKLSADSQAKAARPLLTFLAAEIPCQILASSLVDWKHVDLPEAKSPLSAFLKRIKRVTPCTLSELRGMVEQPGMGRLRAILHADQESVRRVAEI
jgi:hypothetical protein